MIEGIGDDFIPGIVDKDLIDDIVLIDDLDAINMAKIIAKKFGLGIGISGGANFLAGVVKNDDALMIATVFPDDNKKYITTKLSEPIDENPDLILSDITTNLDNNNYEILSNRENAIKRGIQLLENNDILMVLGKGHEKYQIINGIKYPFDDKQIVIDNI